MIPAYSSLRIRGELGRLSAGAYWMWLTPGRDQEPVLVCKVPVDTPVSGVEVEVVRLEKHWLEPDDQGVGGDVLRFPIEWRDQPADPLRLEALLDPRDPEDMVLLAELTNRESVYLLAIADDEAQASELGVKRLVWSEKLRAICGYAMEDCSNTVPAPLTGRKTPSRRWQRLVTRFQQENPL